MPSDLIVNVRQISNYPELIQSDGSETLLVQQGGLGGPYASISAQALVSTGLGDDGSLSVGTGLPGNVGGGNIFAELYVMPLGESLVWNAYGAADATLRYWNNGVMGGLSFSEVGYVLDIAPSGGAGQVVPPGSATPLFVLSQAGALELPHGTLTVARDPAASNEVATLNYVSNNTVQSFNQRQGQVTLNAADVYSALKLCDPLATQPWVNQAITNSLQNLLYTCPFVNTWNGRQGSVYLMLSDITCVFFQSGQQPISPTPPQGSDDNSIATTEWVHSAMADIYVADYGAKGDGITDDSAALQAALNAAEAKGGGAVTIGSLRLYIASNITVTDNVRLVGEFRHGIANQVDWYAFGSQIKLAANATVSVYGNCERILFIKAGLYTQVPQNPTDAANLVANYGGTAVSCVNGSDVYISECMFLGFTTGIDASTSSRMNVMDCRFDCTNGIYCSNSSDISRYHRNHFWPFMTIYTPGVGPPPSAYLPMQRSGYAIKAENNTWDQFVDCFQFAYYQGFWCDNGSNETFIGCHSDYTTPADNSVAGFQFTGTTAYAKLIGSFVVACNTGVAINTTGGTLNPAVEVIGGTFANNQHCIDVVNGGALVHGATFEVGTVGVAFGAGTVTGSVIGCNFNGVTQGISFANATVQNGVTVLGNTATAGTPVTNEQTAAQLTVPLMKVVNTTVSWQSEATSAPLDQKYSDVVIDGSGTINYRLLNDAYTSANTWLEVTRTGDMPEVVQLYAASAIVAYGNLTISTPAGPTIESGAGVPNWTKPVGSIWLRSDGAVGSHLYVTAGGGTWNAVAGV